MPAFDSLEDLLAVPPATGFTSGFNTYSLGYRRESNPLEAVRRNWQDGPPSPQVAHRSRDDARARAVLTAEALPLSPTATYRQLLPSTAPLSASTAPVWTASPVRTVVGGSLTAQPLPAASAPRRAASPPRALAAAGGFAADGCGGATMAKVLSPPSAASLPPPPPRVLQPTALPAAGPRAPAQGLSAGPGQAGMLQLVVPHPLDGSKLGITVKQLVVATITDPRALDFGWALGDRILSVNGVPVADTKALSAALAGALSAWRATGQVLVFDVLRPPGTVVDGGAGGYNFQGPLPPGQESLYASAGGAAGMAPPLAAGSSPALTTFIPWSQLGCAGRGPPGVPTGPPGTHMGLPGAPMGSHGAGGYPQHPGANHFPAEQAAFAGGHAHHLSHPQAGAGGHPHHNLHPHAGREHQGSGARQGSARRSFSKRRAIC